MQVMYLHDNIYKMQWIIIKYKYNKHGKKANALLLNQCKVKSILIIEYYRFWSVIEVL